MPAWIIAALPLLFDAGKELYSIASDLISGKITSEDEFHARLDAMKESLTKASADYRAMRAGTGAGGRG